MTEEVIAPTTEQPAASNLSLLASKHFGSDFHGEVTEQPEPAETEIIEEAPEAEALPEAAEQETEEVAETEVVETQEVEQEYELSHIAQLLGVEESQLDVSDEGKVILSGKVDGEPIKTSAADLLKNHQMHSAADKRLADAKEKASRANEEIAAKVEQVNQQYLQAGEIIKQAESLLAKEQTNIDWDALKEHDPAEYAAKKIEMQDKQAEIEAMRQSALEGYQRHQQEQAAEAERQFQEYLQEEQKALLSKIPEWENEAKATEEKTQIADYLLKQGFSETDIGNASDHRLILLARKAMLHDQGRANTNAKEKKIVKIPKVMKPGAPKSATEQKNATVSKLAEKARKSGSERDALALLQAKRKAS